jgi:5'-deoxynucleotidase YfbR-like HD superfamily hydrolase
MVESLPKQLGAKVKTLWREYEYQKTPEAKLVKALDKIEATFQSLQAEDVSYWTQYGDGHTYFKIALGDGRKKYYQHEKLLVDMMEILKETSRTKMRQAGFKPEDYEKDI